MFAIKRVYEPYVRSDGFRVLIDRLWPRGVSKADAHVDLWAKDIAPSPELRAWYGHDPEKWPEFRRRYSRELRLRSAAVVLDELVRRARRSRVTLVYASRDAEISNVAVVEPLLSRRLAALKARDKRPAGAPAR
jgi:uncharacterized protein YeaO (DUF488 family)